LPSLENVYIIDPFPYLLSVKQASINVATARDEYL
jgi:hypothetical protein